MIDTFELFLFLIVVFMVLSAVFSGSETALTAARRSRIHALQTQGSRRAQQVVELTENREQLISSILVGNNLFNIAAASMATYAFTEAFGQAGVFYATTAMTIIVVIFAEILPKIYSIRNSERVALAVAPFMRFVVWVAYPFTIALQGIVHLVFLLVGRGEQGDATPFDREVRSALALYMREGRLVKDEHAMLDGVLDLSQVDVSRVMTHRRSMQTISVDEPIEQIIETVMKSPYTRIPLWREDPDNIVGVLHARDLFRELYQRQNQSFGVSDVTNEPWFVLNTTSLSEQLKAFRERHVHFALVVDEYGALMGLVTLEDVLEEIVGDIADEHDVAEPEPAVAEDGVLTINGSASIRDINREFDWTLPEDEAATIAGLVIHEAQQIPEVGQIFHFHGFRFEVTGRQRNQIVELRVTPSPGTE